MRHQQKERRVHDVFIVSPGPLPPRLPPKLKNCLMQRIDTTMQY